MDSMQQRWETRIMRKNTKKYKRELAAAKADIKRLLTEEHLPCEFCRYEAQMDVPCTQGDKEWCRQHAVWKGYKQLNQNLAEKRKWKNLKTLQKTN